MTAPDVDFYIPAPSHRTIAKERLGRQRDTMFSWRSDHNETAFHPISGRRCAKVQGYEARPRQVLLTGSARETELREKERKVVGSVWDGATGHHVDRRREWRVTGFQFERAHFRTSEDRRSDYHASRKVALHTMSFAEKRQAIAADPYEPYFHDAITLCQPPSGARVTSLAVTRNVAESEEREKAGTQQQQLSRRGNSSGGGSDSSGNWCTVMGPSISAKQRAVGLAETMHADLLQQFSNPNSRARASSHLQIPTSELAFSVRNSFVERPYHRSLDGKRGCGSVGGAGSPSSDKPHSGRMAPQSEAAVAAAQEEDGAVRRGVRILEAANTMQRTIPREEGDRPLPAEAKSERLYAVQLHRVRTNKDTSMVRRQEPLRKGVPVSLPQSWMSPMSY